MNICLLTIGDGRDEYHDRSRQSIAEKLPPFLDAVHIDDRDHKLGFAGAVAEGWRQVLQTDAEYVWHAELDFLYDREVPLVTMATILRDRPHLTQLALFRQPWNSEEKAAGSIYNLIENDLTPVEVDGQSWLEHRRPNTTNPSIWPRWVLERGWPQVKNSEGIFGGQLIASDPELRGAYWGRGEQWCTHIGDERKGTGY